MNLDKAAIFPVNRSTSLTDVGLLMLMIAPHLSGLASMPLSEIMYPKNFPPVTPNEHLVGFNLMLCRRISANASSKFAQWRSMSSSRTIIFSACHESSFVFIRRMHPNLIVPEVSIHQTKPAVSRRAIHQFIYVGEWIVIFGAMAIEASVIFTHTPLLVWL